MPPKKLYAIQALRCVAILSVIVFHFLAIERKYAGGDTLLPDFFRLGKSGVDLFFVISGFIMVTVTRGQFSSARSSLRFLWSRATRIYPVYWFYFSLTLAVFLLKPGMVNASQGNQANLLASFLLLPDTLLPLVMVAWSLIHELWFYLVFAVLLIMAERFLPILLVLAAVIIVAINFLTDYASLTPALRVMGHPYSLEFLIGSLGALFCYSQHANYISSRMLKITAILAVLVGMPLCYKFELMTENFFVQSCFFGGLYGVLLISMALLEMRGVIQIPRWLSTIGDMSYSIYLSHVLVLGVLGRLWLSIGPLQNNLFDDFLVWPVMLLAVLAWGRLSFRWIELPISRFTHQMVRR